MTNGSGNTPRVETILLRQGIGLQIRRRINPSFKRKNSSLNKWSKGRDLGFSSSCKDKKNFLWRAIGGAIPIVDQITARGMRVDSRCQNCGLEGESINHVLFECTAARQIWTLSDVPLPQTGFNPGSIYTNLSYIIILRKNWAIPL